MGVLLSLLVAVTIGVVATRARRAAVEQAVGRQEASSSSSEECASSNADHPVEAVDFDNQCVQVPERDTSENHPQTRESAPDTDTGQQVDLNDDDAIVRLLEHNPVEKMGSLLARYPDRTNILNALGVMRYEEYNESHDSRKLSDAICLVQQALLYSSERQPEYLQSLENLSITHLALYRSSGDTRDLEDTIKWSQQAVKLFPDTDYPRIPGLVCLANALHYSFSNSDRLDRLEEAIWAYRSLLELLPETDTSCAWYNHNLAVACDSRFEHFGELSDLSACVKHHRKALSLRPQGHPDRVTSLSKLGIVLLGHYGWLNNNDNLDFAITLFKEVLELCPKNHPEHAPTLMLLAQAFYARFRLFERKDDVGRTQQLYQTMLEQYPYGHPSHAHVIDFVATALVTQADDSGDVQDLPRAITLYHELRDREGGVHRASALSGLAKAYIIRFQSTGCIDDISAAIATEQEALALRPPGNPRRLLSLTNVATALSTRWEHLNLLRGTANLDDLDSSIEYLRDALKLCPGTNPKRAVFVAALADALYRRYEATQHLPNLENMMTLLDAEIRSHSQSHVSYARVLKSHARGLLSWFQHSRDFADVDTCIEELSRALQLFPQHDQKSQRSCQRILGEAYSMRFQFSASLVDLEKSISLYDELLKRPSGTASDRASLLHETAGNMNTRYHYSGNVDDLRRDICLCDEALKLLTEKHARYCGILTRLANSLADRFKRFGDRNDLTRAIALHRKVLKLRGTEHRGRPFSLANLAGALHIQFEVSGSLDDEEDGIRLYREAVDLCPSGHRHRAWALLNLATALVFRFRQYDDIADLDTAIDMGEESVALYPKTHFNRSLALHSLAAALVIRYGKLSRTADFDRAIQVQEEEITALSEADPIRASAYGTIASGHYLHFERTQDVDSLNRSIELCTEALKLLPEVHPDRAKILHYQSNFLFGRGQWHNAIPDMEEALRVGDLALKALPQYHPDRSLYGQSMAWFHLHHFRTTKVQTDLDLAIQSFKLSVGDTHRSARLRLNDASHWLAAVETCESFSQSQRVSLLEAYKLTLRLLPLVAYFGLDIDSRLQSLKQSERIAGDGAAHALVLGHLETAVEMLEEGRAVFWTQALRLRTTFDSLPSQLAQDLKSTANQLERESYQKPVADNKAIAGSPARFLEEEAARRRRLSVDFERLAEEARTYPGHERFLLNEEFSHLAPVADQGFVVLLVASKNLCQGLLIDKTRAINRIDFPSVTVEKLEKLSNVLKGNNVKLRNADVDDKLDFATERLGYQGSGAQSIFLGYLWQKIVKPIVKSLGLQIARGRDRPRVWWCPTGPFSFLPVHAAGIYREDGLGDECCSDYVVSSYTPTLNGLLNARKDLKHLRREHAKVLLVAESGAPGSITYLKSAEEEMRTVAAIVGADAVLRLEEGTGEPLSMSPTVEMVINQLPRASLVHLSCHGQQDVSNPLGSGFILRNRQKLTVAALMQLRLTLAFFAFLGACETAKGDRAQPNQAVHLAATMLFTGFKSIIGTMWSMWDKDGPFVAEVIYGAVFKGDVLDPNVIPYALDSAVQQLRARGTPAEQWATYIHVGI